MNPLFVFTVLMDKTKYITYIAYYIIVDLTPPNLSVFTTAETLRVDPTSYYQISQRKLKVFIFVIFYID